MNLRPTRLISVLAVAAITLLVPTIASGSPVDDKRAQAARLQGEIDSNGAKIDALSERANGARYRLDQATAAAQDAQVRIDAAKAEADRVTNLLRGRAVSIYKSGGSATPLDGIDVGNAREYAARSKYASAASNHDNSLVDQLKNARDELTTRKAEYDKMVQQASDEQSSIDTSRLEIEAANAKQAQLLGQVKGEIATLVQQEEQRKQAEAAARARAMTTPRPAARTSGGSSSGRGSRAGAGGGGGAPVNLPGASGGAAAAIAFARAQLGKPYVYAAAGPDAYDCSGLTMRAWEAGGVSMPHYSGAQMGMFPSVPLDALQPGDLIFWGPGGSDHVALYEGGGTVIYAPQTGSFVKEAPIYGSPSGAVRPG